VPTSSWAGPRADLYSAPGYPGRRVAPRRCARKSVAFRDWTSPSRLPRSKLAALGTPCSLGGVCMVSRRHGLSGRLGIYTANRGTTDGSRTRALGATIRCHRFLGVAGCCRIGLDKRISLLVVAHRCCVLRPEWCQKWCQTVSPTTSVVRIVAPSTSSDAATSFSIEAAPRDCPRAATREKVLLLHLATGGPHMTRQSTPETARARARSPCAWLTRAAQRLSSAYPSSTSTCRSSAARRGGPQKPSSRLWRAVRARSCKRSSQNLPSTHSGE
jgi:hypothetical protein